MDLPVIVFDGVCGLCHRAVRFVLRHDRKGHFRFAPAQSAAGRSFLTQYGLDADRMDTIVLVEDGHVFTKSTAVLRIGQRLGLFWGLAARIAGLMPRGWRDHLYDRIAAARYKRYGKLSSCPTPEPEVRGRFLD